MALDHLTDTDQATLTAVLTTWRAEGVENPTLPIFDDIDGDGIPDFYGLDNNGELVIVSGATIDGSVYEATGEDDER